MTTEPAKASAIELSVENIDQLFETLDPYPFRERDLDKDAEEFIVGWARDLPRDQGLKLLIHLPEAQVKSDTAREAQRGIPLFFQHRADATRRDLRELFRVGRTSFLIGIGVLVACVVGAQYAQSMIGETPLGRTVEESLIILGWVANWRPLEIFLYEWWPLVRRRNLYRRLAAAPVEFTAQAH